MPIKTRNKWTYIKKGMRKEMGNNWENVDQLLSVNNFVCGGLEDYQVYLMLDIWFGLSYVYSVIANVEFSFRHSEIKISVEYFRFFC